MSANPGLRFRVNPVEHLKNQGVLVEHDSALQRLENFLIIPY